MPVEQNEGLIILMDTITNNLRHQDYARVIKIAEDYTTYATGQGIDNKLKRFVMRESEEAFEQRKLLTQCNTPDIFNSCIKPLYKVGRTPAAIAIHWEGKDANKTTELKKKLAEAGKNFWGKKNVSKYITQRQADLDSTDPNSFVVVEFKERVDPTDPKTKARPYPFEVNSREAINYVYENNELKWLIVLNACVMVDSKNKKSAGEKYYMYLDNWTLTATQIHKDKVLQAQQDGAVLISELPTFVPGSADFLTEGTKYIVGTEEKREKKRYYVLEAFNHKIGFVPAMRFGTVLDATTRNRTCVPIVHTAQSYFEKSIKAISELDLSMCLHMFPQKVQYSDPCPGEATENGWIGCASGMRPDGKTKCRVCGGSGYKVHTSAQDVIQIRMPKNLDEIVSLENIMVYKSPPIDLLEFQKKFGMYELKQAAQGAIYNSDIFSRQEIATTATEKTINLDSVYDTITPYADTWSEMYVFINKCIAELIDIGEGLTVVHEFPKDFKMQTVSQMLDDLKKAEDSGVPSYIKDSIIRDIARKVFIDQPQTILQIETKNRLFPFPGKTEAEINFIIANSLTAEKYKILWANFDKILSDISYEQSLLNLDFYQMDESKQRELLDKKTEEFLLQIQEDASKNAAISFTAAPAGDNGAQNGEPGAGAGNNA